MSCPWTLQLSRESRRIQVICAINLRFKKIKGKILYTYKDKTRLLSFDRTQSRVVTGLLTGHNTLRRILYIMGLMDSPLCRGENLSPCLCECEALVACRHAYLGSSFLDPEDARSLSVGAIWNFSNVAGLPWLGQQITRHKGHVQKAYVHRDR